MSGAALMAAAASAAGVAGVWELLATVEPARVVAVLRPLGSAAAEGRAPSADERRRLGLLVCATLFAAGWLVKGVVIGALAAAAGPFLLNALFVSRRRSYRTRLAAGAPATARALAAGLAAGRSLRGAIAEAATGLDGPAGHELRRTEAMIAAGIGTVTALEDLRVRAGSRAWDTLVAAILVQRDAGGDLPGLLRELALAQEAATRTDQDAQAATAQARFTARLVTGLPGVAIVLAELASPGFATGLLTNPLSLVLVVLALGLQLVAYVGVRAISRRLAAP